MTTTGRPAGDRGPGRPMRCGNDPRTRLDDGDRAVVVAFRGYLHALHQADQLGAAGLVDVAGLVADTRRPAWWTEPCEMHQADPVPGSALVCGCHCVTTGPIVLCPRHLAIAGGRRTGVVYACPGSVHDGVCCVRFAALPGGLQTALGWRHQAAGDVVDQDQAGRLWPARPPAMTEDQADADATENGWRAGDA